jgi:hypothetical protein
LIRWKAGIDLTNRSSSFTAVFADIQRRRLQGRMSVPP